jgi:hypothetical protein
MVYISAIGEHAAGDSAGRFRRRWEEWVAMVQGGKRNVRR